MKTLKVPKQYYLGVISAVTTGVATGYLSPFGEDSAGKKRLASIQDWLNRTGPSYHKLGIHVIENTPQTGFKIAGVIRSYSSGGSDRWSIQDPRGFLNDISSGNLAELIESCVIDNGEILNPCVWGRMGSANVLLNSETEAYQEAVENTKISESTTSWRDVALGNRVILQNGVEGVYLGKVGVITREYFDTDYAREVTQNGIRINNSFFTSIYSSDDNIIHLIASPKLSSILSNDVLTQQESEKTLNTVLGNGASIRSHVFFTRPVALFSMEKKSDVVEKFTLELELCQEQPTPRSYQKMLLCQHKEGFGELVSFSNRTMCYEIDLDALREHKYLPKFVAPAYHRQSRLVQQHNSIDPATVQGYYHLYCNFKTPCGNTHRIRI